MFQCSATAAPCCSSWGWQHCHSMWYHSYYFPRRWTVDMLSETSNHESLLYSAISTSNSFFSRISVSVVESLGRRLCYDAAARSVIFYRNNKLADFYRSCFHPLFMGEETEMWLSVCQHWYMYYQCRYRNYTLGTENKNKLSFFKFLRGIKGHLVKHSGLYDILPLFCTVCWCF